MEGVSQTEQALSMDVFMNWDHGLRHCIVLIKRYSVTLSEEDWNGINPFESPKPAFWHVRSSSGDRVALVACHEVFVKASSSLLS